MDQSVNSQRTKWSRFCHQCCMFTIFRHVFNTDIRTFSAFGCKLHKFLVYLTGTSVGWILIVLSLDRCLIICFKRTTKGSTRKRKLTLILILIFVSLVCINLHFFWTFSLYPFPESNNTNTTAWICWFDEHKYQTFIVHYWSFINLAFYSFLPFTVVIIANGIIIYKVRKTLHIFFQTWCGIGHLSMGSTC